MAGLAPPSIPVFPAGYGPFAGDFNGWVTNPIQFIATQIVLRVSRSTSQSLTTGGGNQVVRFNVVDEDPYSGWNGSNWTYNPPFTGWYEVNVFVSLAAQGVNARCGISVTNGAQNYNLSQHQCPGGWMGGVSATAMVWMVATEDFVSGNVVVSVNCGTDATNLGRYSRMEIAYVRQ